MIPGGERMPLSAYFPPPVPDPYRYSYQLISSIPVEDVSRYIDTKILEQSSSISENGLTAQINAHVFINGIVGETVQIWIAANALDENGNTVGVRRIEKIAVLDEVGVIEVSGFVYSTGNPIATVELYAETIYNK